MRKYVGEILVIAFFLPIVIFAGCGKGGDNIDTTPPTIISKSKSPADEAEKVVINTLVTFSFDKDVAGVSQSSVILTPINTPISVNADVTYDSATRTVTLKPKNNLAIDTYYVVAVTSDIHSSTGVPFKAESWVFTTGQALDTEPPYVNKVTPAKDSSYVDVNSKITAFFNEAIVPGTVYGDTFVGGTVTKTGTFRIKNLKTGKYVSGEVAYDEGHTSASFVLKNSSGVTVDFDDWTNYQVELTSGITDLAGNGLTGGSDPAKIYTLYSFMTNDENPPTILNKYPSSESTNIARNAQVTVEFSESIRLETITKASNFYMEDDTTHTTVVTNVVYDESTKSATLIPVNPSPLNTNVWYRVHLTSDVKDLANNSLSAIDWRFQTGGLVADTTPPHIIYKTPDVNNINVDPAQSVIVKFDEDVTGISASSFTLTKTGSASVVDANILYSEPTKTATLTPKDSLDQGAEYNVVLTGDLADGSGNALTYTTWKFITADNTKPVVLNKIPGALGNVAVNTSITVYFSKHLNASTVTASSFSVVNASSGSTAVSGSVVYDDATPSVTFNPDTDFSFSSTYQVTLSNAIKDLAGNTLNPVTWQFVTGSQPDITPPTVESRSPVADALNVSISSPIAFTFSEPIVASNISANTVILKDASGTVISASVQYASDSNQVTIRPNNSLAYSNKHSVTVLGNLSGYEIKDLAGNQFVNDTWSFTTEADVQPPVIIFRSPEKGTKDIPGNAVQIDVAFSEQVTGVDTTSFRIAPASDPTNYFSPTSVTDISTPSAKDYRWRLSLANPSVTPVTITGTYNVTLTSAIQDLAAIPNSLNAPNDWTIDITGKDVTPPSIISKDPAPSAIWRTNAGEYKVKVIFSENVKNIDAATFKLEKDIGGGNWTSVPLKSNPVYTAGLLSAELVVDPVYVVANYNLYDTNFRVTLSGTITDIAGNSLGLQQWTMKTDTDTEAPTVISMYPSNGMADVPYNAGLAITASFSEPVQNVNGTTFYLVKHGDSTHVAGTVTMTSVNSCQLTTSADLEGKVQYDATLTTGITDKATSPNALAANYTWSFTTNDKPDSVKPWVATTTPAGGATGIAPNVVCTVAFSEDVQNATSSYISLHKGSASGSSVPVNVTYVQGTFIASVTPTAPLDGSTTYYLVTSSNVKDLAGNTLDTANGKNLISFSTAADAIGPTCTVAYQTGSNFATIGSGIPTIDVLNPYFVISFSEPASNVTTSTIKFYRGGTAGSNYTDGTAISTYVTYDNTVNKAYVQLAAQASEVVNGVLQYQNATYAINVASTVTDAAGNGLNKTSVVAASATAVAFKTPASLPKISGIRIGNNNAVSRNGNVTNASSTINGLSATSDLEVGMSVTGTGIQAGAIITSITNATTIVISLNGTATTANTPLVFSGFPGVLNNGTNIIVDSTKIEMTFTTAMNPDKVWFELYLHNTDTQVGHALTVTPGQRVWSAGNTVLTIPLTGQFKASTQYDLRVFGWAGSFEDIYGNTLDRATNLTSGVFTFTTTNDVTAPTIISTTPSTGSTSVTALPVIVVRFSEPMDITKGAAAITNGALSATGTWFDSGRTVVFAVTSLTASLAHIVTLTGFTDVKGLALSGNTFSFSTSASSTVTGIIADGFDTYSSPSFTSVKNILTDSSYSDGSTTIGCDWLQSTTASFSSAPATRFASVSGSYFATAADWLWPYGSYADLVSGSALDLSAAGLYILSFSMQHIEQFNQCDRIEVWLSTDGGSSYSQVPNLAGGNSNAIFRFDNTVTSLATAPTPWKKHYVDLTPTLLGLSPQSLRSSVRIKLRAYSAGETGASVYIDELKLERY